MFSFWCSSDPKKVLKKVEEKAVSDAVVGNTSKALMDAKGRAGTVGVSSETTATLAASVSGGVRSNPNRYFISRQDVNKQFTSPADLRATLKLASMGKI